VAGIREHWEDALCATHYAFPRRNGAQGRSRNWTWVCAQNGENCDVRSREHVARWIGRLCGDGNASARFLSAGCEALFWLITQSGLPGGRIATVGWMRFTRGLPGKSRREIGRSSWKAFADAICEPRVYSRELTRRVRFQGSARLLWDRAHSWCCRGDLRLGRDSCSVVDLSAGKIAGRKPSVCSARDAACLGRYRFSHRNAGRPVGPGVTRSCHLLLRMAS